MSTHSNPLNPNHDQPEFPQSHPQSHSSEGPRRQARQHRAQRRAAQQRARALEQARREAKRQLYSQVVFPSKHPTPKLIHLLRIVFFSLIGILILGLISAILYWTPLMSVRRIEIIGADHLSGEQLHEVINVQLHTPLMQVKTARIADRIASLPPVEKVTVQCRYPSTLRVIITERTPVAMKDFPDGIHLFDRDGVDFLTVEPPVDLPYLGVDNPSPVDATTIGALKVLTTLTQQGIEGIGRIDASSLASITLHLSDGKTIIWGSAERTPEKAHKLAALLTQPGTVYDLSSPDLPTVK